MFADMNICAIFVQQFGNDSAKTTFKNNIE